MSIPADYLTSPIKLVNINNQATVVEFPQGLEGDCRFTDDYQDLHEYFLRTGVDVYPERDGKRRFKIGDKGFGEAFYKDYFQSKMSPDRFKWVQG